LMPPKAPKQNTVQHSNLSYNVQTIIVMSQTSINKVCNTNCLKSELEATHAN